MDKQIEIVNRLKRAEGQIRGIIKMIESGRSCQDIVIQLSAAKSALDKSIAQVLTKNLQKCIVTAMEAGDPYHDLVQEAINLIVKMR